MADSTLNKMKDEAANNPGTLRLKDALQSYVQARAQHAVTGLGHKLGDSVTKLANPSEGGGPSALVGDLAKGGKALSEGKSPAQAAMKVGAGHMKDKVKDKVKGLFGGGKGKSGGGKSKSVTIVEDIDVGVPVRTAYDQWTQYQEFSTFAKGVVSVEKADDVASNWKVKVAKSTRSWKANTTEQLPDERITWTTEGAKGTVKGVVTFHRITDDLTRVLMVLEYFPKGLFEKTGNIWRAQGRRARLDLKLYRKFIMMRGEATDGWRGEIRDGEVVVEHDDAVAEEEERKAREEEESEAGSEADAESESGADADADDAEEYEEDEEDEDARAESEDDDEDDEPRAATDELDDDERHDDEETAEDSEDTEDSEDAEDEYDDREDAEDSEEAEDDEYAETAEDADDEEPRGSTRKGAAPADDTERYEDDVDEEEPEKPVRRSRSRAAPARR